MKENRKHISKKQEKDKIEFEYTDKWGLDDKEVVAVINCINI